ncbi:bifunctional 5,10-methylenetetrahydrofolate dehydrogenase/5,10-methenyltetrahydrofolate cyclohydrolase [Candidatus Tisiphia endosymbiont of Beris chalybata]|uniref:bifunctional 5,10-methylenetetrahydrofolate dehydrogenase/5,10-methenyltetrahydrofolate cyclohydrolase n=1 Tax=Candidatus Tisiphia endosymbiont of Beris chalybata TaxID=3066262 RepID=UPI00312CBF41
MSPNNIINGRYFAGEILSKLAAEIENLKQRHQLVPALAIILVGANPASTLYIRNKLRAAEKIGMKAVQINLPDNVSINHIIKEIKHLNEDPTISGIIVQLPLPPHIDNNIILSAINPNKDVDGFHPLNVGYLHSDLGNGFIPCTALGCIELLKHVDSNLEGKNAVVIGRSNIVGKPLAALLLKENCTVSICHSSTQNLRSITMQADIVISAIGVPLKLTEEYFNPHSIVIDVGISKIPGTDKIVGDVDFINVVNKVRYISPVPGGVGPMTVAFLLQNTLKAALRSHYKLK